MNKSVALAIEGHTPLRAVIAVSMLFTLGACTTGPTRPPFRPSTAAAPAAAKPVNQVAGTKPASKQSPQVKVTPLQQPAMTKQEVPTDEAATSKPETTKPPLFTAAQIAANNVIPAPRPEVAEDGASKKTDAEAITPLKPPAIAAQTQDLPGQETARMTPVSNAPTSQMDTNQCWGQLTIVPKSTRKTVQLVTEQAHTRYKVAQARLRNEQLPVVVKDAAQTYKLAEPQYVQVTESVKVQEEYTRLRVEPVMPREVV